jgi:hypothetical protein
MRKLLALLALLLTTSAMAQTGQMSQLPSFNQTIHIVTGGTYQLVASGTQPLRSLYIQNNNTNSTVTSLSLATAGAGCTTGSQTFTVVGGTGTAATFTSTVAAGVLTSPLTLVSRGNYTAAPLSPAPATGGGCTTAPTVNLASALDACWLEISGTVAVGNTLSTAVTIPGQTASTAQAVSILLNSSREYIRYSPHGPTGPIVATCTTTGDSLYVDWQ